MSFPWAEEYRPKNGFMRWLDQRLPLGGTAVAIALVGTDIKNKGVLKGVLNSGIDAIPFVGLAKNAVELFTGDFIPDKKAVK